MLDNRRFEKNLKLWIAATRGGPMRARILHELIAKPQNPNQLADFLKVDYKTVTHHLSVLKKNGWVTSNQSSYGEVFSCTFLPEQQLAFESFLKPLLEKSFKTPKPSD